MTNLPKKYLLGLDLGTDSVGWALTDENYNVIKKSGKSLWGVRLFDAASDCAERRTHRADRRRLQRRKERIELLKELFGEEVGKVDFTFFERIEESFLHKEDRRKEYDYSLFIEKDFNDKTYYKKYPTIYHLRKHLLESNEKEDIRLIYLALAHMIKYRGHFLFETPDFKPSNKDDAKNIFDKINEVFKTMDEEEYELPFNDEIFGKLITANKASRGITSLIDKLKEILNPLKKKLINKVVIPLIAGGTVGVSKIFEVEDFTDIKDICCKKESFDEDVNSLMSAFPQHESILTVVQYCKELCNFFILDKLLNGEEYLSDVMVKRYDDHKMDLDKLKKYIKLNCKEEYFNIFRDASDKKGNKNKFNYVHYIGGNTNNNIKVRIKHCNKDDFYNYIKNKLGIPKEEADRKNIRNKFLLEIFDKMSDGSYLARQNSTDNGVFPYQLNKLELKIILEKQSKFYDFFNVKDEYGTVADKILSILEYKIPYYVGPLNGPKDENKNNFSWVVRTKEKITPWNFEKVVDLEGSAEAFIYRMLNKCQYLPSCYCLAKNSIIYQYYCVLSELNKILINGTQISVEQKKDLLKNLYLENKNVTKKALIAFFKGRYGEDVVVTTSTGKELEEIHSNMSSLIDFKNIFGLSFVKENLDKIEEIIRDITLFEDKKILSKRLESKYGIKDKETINKINSFSYKKYGRLSKELLFSIHGINEQGEIVRDSIISIMENDNYNLMEIINNVHYRMGDAIKRFNMEHSQFDNQKGTSEEVENYINDLYVSPGMKRSLIQSYKIIEELEGIVKHPIDEFYVECTRSNQQEKVRKDSRYSTLDIMYKEAIEIAKKSYKSEVNNLMQVQKELQGYAKSQSSLKRDMIFLYFTQLGKCIYTGAPIDIKDIVNNSKNKYDIDHIFPQSKIKDDSLSNRVLCTLKANREDNEDKYPKIYKDTADYKHEGFINMLHDMKLISEKKKCNLLRKDKLNEDELLSFVDRQLVFTSQSVKALCDLLNTFKVKDDNSVKVIYSKAENVSDFRKKYDILKCRDANNYHHAHDAYLNVVVGRMIYNYYSFTTKKGRLASFKKEGKATNISKIFDDNEKRTKLPIIDSQNNIIWHYKKTLKKVQDQIRKHYDILTTTRSYIGNSLFKEQSITKACDFKGDNLMPRKSTDNYPLSALKDVSKYGGFNKPSYCSFSLIKSKDKKGKEVYSIEAMPALLSKKSVEEQLEYFASKKKLIDPKVVIETLKINTVIKMGSSKCCITGKTNDSYLLKNLIEMNYSYKYYEIIRKVSKLFDILSKNKCISTDGKIDRECEYLINKENSNFVLSPAKNEQCEEISINLLECQLLFKELHSDFEKNVFKEQSVFKNIKTLIDNSYDDIINFDIFNYCVLLHELVTLFKCDRVTTDLRIIGGAKSSGILQLAKNINKQIEIIFESITGFYVKTIWKN